MYMLHVMYTYTCYVYLYMLCIPIHAVYDHFVLAVRIAPRMIL